MPTARSRSTVAAFALLASATTASAFELDPSVAQPLNQLLVTATQGCQAGNARACSIGRQLNVLGNQLFYVQASCAGGDRSACVEIDTVATQLQSQVRAMIRTRAEAGTAYGSRERQAMRQRAFATHEERLRQPPVAVKGDDQHFLDYLRR